MTQRNEFDNPNDIHSLSTFNIKTVSRNYSPVIYANARNQLPVEVFVKALDKNDKSLKFSEGQWIHMLNLCLAESNDKLNWKGHSDWCFTDIKNDYCGEIQKKHVLSREFFSINNDGTAIILMYIYTNKVGLNRISVRLDTDDGKHFTTADISAGAEKSSIQVSSISEIRYKHEDLEPPYQTRNNSNKSNVYYDIATTPLEGSTDYFHGNKYFSCYYENYTYSLRNGYEIVNANVHGYCDINGYRKWICTYDSEHNNQHMIVAHSFSKKGSSINIEEKKETFGFENTASWSGAIAWGFGGYQRGKGKFNLRQEVTYPVNQNKICFTQMAFNTDEAWELPDNVGMDGQPPFSFDT